MESYFSFSLWNFIYKVRLTNGSIRPMTLTGEKNIIISNKLMFRFVKAA